MHRAFGGLVGLAICNDRRWPETYRVLGLQGVELVLIGYNTPIHYAPDPAQDRLAGFHNNLVMAAGRVPERHVGRRRGQGRRRGGRRLAGREPDHRPVGRGRGAGHDRRRRGDRRRVRPRSLRELQEHAVRLRALPPARALRDHRPDGTDADLDVDLLAFERPVAAAPPSHRRRDAQPRHRLRVHEPRHPGRPARHRLRDARRVLRAARGRQGPVARAREPRSDRATPACSSRRPRRATWPTGRRCSTGATRCRGTIRCARATRTATSTRCCPRTTCRASRRCSTSCTAASSTCRRASCASSPPASVSDERTSTTCCVDGSNLTRAIHYPPMADAPSGTTCGPTRTPTSTSSPRSRAPPGRASSSTTPDGWVDVVPPEGHMIVNSGIMLERLTNGRIPAGVHRVIAPPSEAAVDRYSVVQFCHPAPWF